MGSWILLRCISKSKVAGNSLRCIFPGIFGRGRMLSTFDSTCDESRVRVPPLPLLMRPSYKEKSRLSEEKVSNDEFQFQFSSEIVGSSHGFVVARSDDGGLFMYNPISRSRVNLPPIPQGHGPVKKVILSCSPGEEECRAAMRFGGEGGDNSRLAFCCPGRSTEWTIIGHGKDNYRDIVYSGPYNLLFCLTEEQRLTLTDELGLEGWDLQDPHSPRLHWSVKNYKSLEQEVVEEEEQEVVEEEEQEVVEEEMELVRGYSRVYVVASQEEKELFAVARCEDVNSWRRSTTGFDACKIIVGEEGENQGKRIVMKHHLEGKVMFVGGAFHSVAVTAGDGFPQSNSIFFTGYDGSIAEPDSGRLRSAIKQLVQGLGFVVLHTV